MRKAVKEQILQLLATLQEAHKEMQSLLRQREYDNVRGIMADCQDGAVLVGNTIEQFAPEHTAIVAQLENYCEYLFHVYEELEKGCRLKDTEIRQDLDEYIKEITEAVKRDIRVVLKVLFMPYKASMWTSLESIWKAAAEDAECEAKVVVMPYYTLGTEYREPKLEYEASMFPEYVPITHYSEYNVAAEQPDMIFIHNPYDDTNNITRVPEQYYSDNLKKYTGKLIYSPYGMMGYYNPEQGAFMCCTKAARVADEVLVQSERVKEIYIAHGVNKDKLIALGSPKVDAVVDGLKKSVLYPEGWEQKLKGKKVFLYNTHLSYFIKGHAYAKEHPDKGDFAKAYHENIFGQLLNREGCALIWRPHPLLKTTLENRGLFDSLEFVEELERRIKASDNAVLDENGEYDIAFGLSDALVTTYSSMIPEYMISGKPIYIYQNRLNEENCKKSPVDYTHNYYKARKGEEPTFPKFIQMVLNGEDILYEQRMKDVHRAFDNLEGTIGKNIYQLLKDEWKRF